MALSISALHTLEQGTETDAWRVIVDHAVELASKPLAVANAASEVVRRDREIGELDLFLSSSGWDLWRAFGGSVERTSDRLGRWWAEPFSAKALLILDGLSLRELPWLLHGAKERGFTLHEVGAHASELPGETDQFARALGFACRSKLQNKETALKMLKSKNSSRHQYSSLFSIHAGFKSCPDSYFCFTKAHVTTDQPVHWRRRFHILFYICRCLTLVGCIFINKRSFQFCLHVIIRRMLKPLLGFSFGVQLNQVKGNFLNLCFRFLL